MMKLFVLILYITLHITSLYGATLTLSPTNGATAGGTGIVIEASSPNFGSYRTATATFGTNPAVACTKINAGNMICSSPSNGGVSESVTVSVTTNLAVYGATTTYQYQDINGVVVAPQMGPSAGGTTVTVTNTNSGYISSINLGCQFGINSGNTAVATFGTVSSLTCLTVAGTNGQTITIQVTDNENDFFPTSATTSTNFLYNDITVSSIAPNSGTSAGGTSITVTGTGFLTGYTPECEFGTTIVAATINSGTNATCTTPAGATGGVAFQFTNNGQNFVAGGTYTYV